MSQFKGPLSSMIAQDFTDAKRSLFDTIWTTLRINVGVEILENSWIETHHCLIGAADRFMIKQYAKSSGGTATASGSAPTAGFINETNQAVESLSKKVKMQADEIKQLKKLVSDLSSHLQRVKEKRRRRRKLRVVSDHLGIQRRRNLMIYGNIKSRKECWN